MPRVRSMSMFMVLGKALKLAAVGKVMSLECHVFHGFCESPAPFGLFL